MKYAGRDSAPIFFSQPLPDSALNIIFHTVSDK